MPVGFLPGILAGSRTFVHAVVRSKSAEEASDALHALPLEQRSRVNLIDGDAAAIDFGLRGRVRASRAR